MSAIDEILRDAPPESNNLNYFDDPIVLYVDDDSRRITVPAIGGVIGVKGDRDVNRINFQMPRYYNGFDMSTFTPKINFINAVENTSFYIADDLEIYEEDQIRFSWLVDGFCCIEPGTISFCVCLYTTKIYNDREYYDQRFFSTIGTGVVLDTVLTIGESGEIPVILTGYEKELADMQDQINAFHREVALFEGTLVNFNEQLDEMDTLIEAGKERVQQFIDSIPEDVQEQINELHRVISALRDDLPKGTVTSVNGTEPDSNGNVVIEIPENIIKTINSKSPDQNGNIELDLDGNVKSVNGIIPDDNGNIRINVDGKIRSVNDVAPDENGNIKIDVGGKVRSVNGVEPDTTGNVVIKTGGIHVSISPPVQTDLLWIDTSQNGVIKYYSNGSWRAVAAAWG